LRPPLLIRIYRLHAKLAIAAAIGMAIAALTLLFPYGLRVPTRLLIGWDGGLALYMVLMIATIWPADVAQIRRRAAEEDEGAFAILVLSVGATLASLIAVIVLLGGPRAAVPRQATLHIALAVATILLSWSFMHAIFSMHYAHEYYGEGSDRTTGGLRFPGEDGEPDYRDFMYFSVVIGMTSQTSDVDITSKAIRRIAAVHGFLSFFFNLTVLALTVNMVSSLV
jgi:uncharacterized membrane protein